MPAPISKFNGERGEKISSENRFGSLQIASYLRYNGGGWNFFFFFVLQLGFGWWVGLFWCLEVGGEVLLLSTASCCGGSLCLMKSYLQKYSSFISDTQLRVICKFCNRGIYWHCLSFISLLNTSRKSRLGYYSKQFFMHLYSDSSRKADIVILYDRIRQRIPNHACPPYLPTRK